MVNINIFNRMFFNDIFLPPPHFNLVNETRGFLNLAMSTKEKLNILAICVFVLVPLRKAELAMYSTILFGVFGICKCVWV